MYKQVLKAQGDSVQVQAIGRPRTKGSLRPIHVKVAPGKCRVSLTEDGKFSTPWKNAMIQAIWEACEVGAYAGPVVLTAEFRFERLASEERSSSLWPMRQSGATAHGDLDKLVRNLGDALTQSGLIKDDSQICRIDTSKVFCVDGGQPGVKFWVQAL